jgi:hypothetical protein
MYSLKNLIWSKIVMVPCFQIFGLDFYKKIQEIKLMNFIEGI